MKSKVLTRSLALLLTFVLCVGMLPTAALAEYADPVVPPDVSSEFSEETILPEEEPEQSGAEADWTFQKGNTTETVAPQEGWITATANGVTIDHAKMIADTKATDWVVFNNKAEPYRNSELEYDITFTNPADGDWVAVAPATRVIDGKNYEGFAIQSKADDLQRTGRKGGKENYGGVTNQAGVKFEYNKTYHLRMVTMENRITVYVTVPDGVEQKLAEFDSPINLGASTYGFRIWRNSKTVTIENIERTELKSRLNETEATIPYEEWCTAAIDIPVSFAPGDSVASIEESETPLTLDTDYSVNTVDSVITLSADYLADKAEESEIALTVTFASGVEATYTMTRGEEPKEDSVEDWTFQKGNTTETVAPQEGWITATENGVTIDHAKMIADTKATDWVVFNNKAEPYRNSELAYDITFTNPVDGDWVAVAPATRVTDGKNYEGFAMERGASLQRTGRKGGKENYGGVTNQAGIKFEYNKTYHLRMVTMENRITVYVTVPDGVEQKLAEFDSPIGLNTGTYGFRIWRNSKTVTIENIVRAEIVISAVEKPSVSIGADAWGKSDVTIPVTYGAGDSVKSIVNGSAVLEAAKDYTSDETGIILKKDYIAAQDGTFRLTVNFTGSSDQITVIKDVGPFVYVEDFTGNGENWVKEAGNGTVTLEDGALRVTGDTRVVDTASPIAVDGEAEFTIETLTDNGKFGLVYRANGGSWQSFYNNESAKYQFSTGLWNYRNNGGANDQVLEDGTPVLRRSEDVNYTMKVRFVGKTLTVWMDGNPIYSADLNKMEETAGQIGIQTGDGADILLKQVTYRSYEGLEAGENTETKTISKDGLTVTLAADFPRVVSYTLGGKTMDGCVIPKNYVSINGTDYPAAATVTTTTESATYAVTVDMDEDQTVTFNATFTAQDGNVLDMQITDIDETDCTVYTLGFPEQPLLSAKKSQSDAAFNASTRGGDKNLTLAGTAASRTATSYATIAIVTANGLSASMANNVYNNRMEFSYRSFDMADGDVTTGVWNTDFYYRGLDGELMLPTGEDPSCQVVVTEDTNDDNVLNWQDGANALKTLVGDKIPGAETVRNSDFHVGYNFVSEAQQPFLKIADNYKRLGNLIDGFKQVVVLKGYANEGHDSGHADYADINKRAGGAEDLNLMTDAISAAGLGTFGIHINHSEAYPEAKMFTDEVMSTKNGWKWMDQSKYIRREADIMSGGMNERLDDLFEECPDIGFVYVDTYRDDRFAAAKLAQALTGDHEAVLGSEEATKMDRWLAWTHWPANFSDIHRFVYHTQKDVYGGSGNFWGGYNRSESMMSWQHRNSITPLVGTFYTNQLPQKYLMHHEVVRMDGGNAYFEGGIRTNNYKMWKDDKLMVGDGGYFIPWYADDSATKNPDDADKIYYWNNNTGSATWNLPNAEWAKLSTVKLYKTTQTGKVFVADIPVSEGKITISATAKTPYVVYPGEAAADATDWSTGSPIKDTSFNSRDFSIWQKSGDAAMAFNDDGNGVSILTMEGAAAGQVSQTMTGLVPGQKYRALVWAGAENGKTACITVKTPDGGTYMNYVDQIVRGNDCFDTYAKGKRVERVWVDFTQPEGQTTATITLSADACEAANGKATFMESRIVKTAEPDLPDGFAARETFEYVEQGGTGIFTPEGGGDGGYHISETHLPYTSDTIPTGINGENSNFSLKMTGYGSARMRTYPATMRLEPDTKYIMEFDTKTGGTVYIVSERDGNDQPLKQSFQAGHNEFSFTTGAKTDYIARIDGGQVLDNFQVYQYAKSSAKAITTFSISGTKGNIDEVNHTVAVTMPVGTVVTALAPTIGVSAKATVSPASGVKRDFAEPVTYTVTAENGSAQAYTVTVTVAQPVPGTHIVTFDSNGGSYVIPVSVNDGEKVTKPTKPTKKGYNFDGWFSDAELTAAYDFGSAVAGDITLYAKWTEKPGGWFDVAEYNLTWNSPSVNEDDSMPTGNGTIGMNLWTENNRDMVFYISKTGAYNNIYRTIKLGRIRVRFPENTFTEANYTQTLDLSTGSIKVQSGDLNLEFWIDANAPVIHVKGNSIDPKDISVSYELDWRDLTSLKEVPDGNAATEDVLLDNDGDSVIWYHRNSASIWKSGADKRGIKSAESLALDPIENLTFGGAISGVGMARSAAATLTAEDTKELDVSIHIASCQPETPAGFVEEVENVRQANSGDYRTAYEEHAQWWEDYWNNSYIEITSGTVQKPKTYNDSKPAYQDEPLYKTITRNYLLQRFIQGASMRGEALIPFNGNIFNVKNSYSKYSVKTPDDRKWDGLPIMWQNTRLPYWATLVSGDAEQTESLIHYVYKSLPVLEDHTMARFGIEGAHMTEAMMPYGLPDGGSVYDVAHLVYHLTATAEVPLMMVRSYAMTGNLELFQNETMPVVEGILTFFDNRFPKNDENGKMIMYPANNLESSANDTNPASIIAPLTALLDELLQLPNGSLTTEQIHQIVALRNRMPGTEYRTLNGVEFFAQEEKRGSGIYNCRDIPQLYPVWPAQQYGSYQTEGLATARQTFAGSSKWWDPFNDTRPDGLVGGWNQRAINASRLGLPEETAYLLAQCGLDSVDYFYNAAQLPENMQGSIPARFPAFWGPYNDWKPDQCHGGNFMNALQTMLLTYDTEGTIYLLSSWPEDWNVNFRLHGPNKTVVTASYQNGELNYTTSNGNQDIVNMATEEQRIINRVSVACGDQNYKFTDKSGKTIEPMQDGKYDEAAMQKYPVTDEWLEEYGYTLNGTVGAGYGWNDWGGATWDREAGKLYIHLIGFNGSITIPLPENMDLADESNPTCLNNSNANVTAEITGDNLKITMDAASDAVDTIIALDVKQGPEATSYLVNDNDPAIKYFGAFVNGYSANRGEGEYMNDAHTVKNAGANDYFTYTFTGCGIDVIAAKNSGWGTYVVYIDDVKMGEGSCAAGGHSAQQTVFSVENLPQKEHTIKVAVKDGSGVWTAFDAFRVYPTAEVQRIVSLTQPKAITVDFGTAFEDILNLPETVAVKLQSGKQVQVNVQWSCSDYDGNSSGLYTAVGELQLSESLKNPKNLTANIQIAVPAAPSTTYVIVDDTDTDAIKYSAGWKIPGGNDNLACYNGTRHQAGQGESVEFTFTGTGVDYIATLDYNRCRAKVYLDGELVEEIDMSNPTFVARVPAYRVRGLESKAHTLKLELIGTGCCDVDAFKVYSGNKKTIDSVNPPESIGVVIGTPWKELPLPTEVEVTLDDGTTMSLPVGAWTGDYNGDVSGVYLLRAPIELPSDESVLNESNYKANVLIMVSESGGTTPGQIVVRPDTLPEGTEGLTYKETRIQALDGVAPYTYQVLGLPEGLSATDGLISGTPEESGVFSVVAVVRDAENTTLYKVYELRIIERYAVTFEGGEAAEGTAPVQEDMAAGSTFELPENSFTRSGYSFAGWYDGDRTYQPGDTYTMPIMDVTFTALWNQNSGDGTGSGSSNTTSTTKKNADGSTTKTVTDKKTGMVTETTTYPDGTKIVATTPKDGNTSIEVTIPKGKEKVTVTIPTAEKPKPGEVAVIINEDGTREVVKTSVSTKDGLRVTLGRNCKLEIVDNSKSFADVPADHWSADAIAFVTSRELFNGGDGGFQPAGDMSRAMLFTVLARLDGQDLTGGETWYEKAMQWAKANGISDGTNPEASISREQLAVMLYRYAKAEKSEADLTSFTDADDVSSWAAEAMAWAVKSGIITGKGGALDPQGNASRAEVAAMLQRFVSLV